MNDDKGRLSVVHPADPLPAVTQRASRAVMLAAAGMIIVATIVAYVFWVWILLMAMGLGSEVKQSTLASVIYHGGFWEIVRGGGAIIGGGLLTFLTWVVALGIAEDR